MLVDRTNEDIPLSLETDLIELPDGSYQPASLTIEGDFDSSKTPKYWVWVQFSSRDEPWFKLTYSEAEQMYNRLALVLGKVPH